MADMKKEEQESVERLSQPSSKENEILEGNSAREEALKDVKKAKEEEKLPKLSAAEYRVYNSMADNMEYFVSLPFPIEGLNADLLPSITISDNNGIF